MPKIIIAISGGDVEATVNGITSTFDTIAECAEHFGIDTEQLAERLTTKDEATGRLSAVEIVTN